MKSSPHLGPFTAPHKTVQFWMLVTVMAIVFLCEPFILRFFGAPLPQRPYSSWLSSVAITLLVMIPVTWLGFRFGRIAWLLIGVGFLVLGLAFRSIPL